jgi:hypothetical protein
MEPAEVEERATSGVIHSKVAKNEFNMPEAKKQGFLRQVS